MNIYINKTKGILAFLMLSTSMSVFGQFHTISRQSKLYHIEQTDKTPPTEEISVNHILESTNTTISQPTSPVQKADDTAPSSHKRQRNHSNISGNSNDSSTGAERSVERSADIRSQYISNYLSVSFPLNQLIINSPFGVRKDPFTGKTKKHNGIDLHASCNEVYAMMDGTVNKTGEDKRSGKYITIRHGDFLVSYCHLSRIWVKPGTQVKPGEIVGITGNTGRSTGEHLHITCKRNSKYIDPTIFIQYIKDVREHSLQSLCDSE